MTKEYDGNRMVAVFIANRSTNHGITKAIYIMDLKDGIKFCTDDRTKGKGWSFHWTILSNFINEKTNKIEQKGFKKDNGMFKDLLKELNITPYDLNELKDVEFEGLDEHLSDEILGEAKQAIIDEKNHCC